MKNIIVKIMFLVPFILLTACNEKETPPAPAPVVAPASEKNSANEALNHFKPTNRTRENTYKNPKF